ncbi:MAG: hypothetical protein V4519_00365 [Patescibacteria group bacterium]
MKYTSEQLDAAFNELPPSLQEFIMSEEVTSEIYGIADDFYIPPIKLGDFDQLVFALLVGIMPVQEFLVEIQNGYNLNEDDAQDLLIDIDAILLEPVFMLMAEAMGEIGDTAQAVNPLSTGAVSPSSTQQTAPRPKITLNFPDSPTVGGYKTDGPVPLMPKNRPSTDTAHSSPSTTYPKITINTGVPTPPPVFPSTPSDHLLRDHFMSGPAPIPTPHIEPVKPVSTPVQVPIQRINPEPPQNIPTGPTPTSIFQSKLQGTSRVPTEEMNLGAKNKPRDGSDPYREPPTA